MSAANVDATKLRNNNCSTSLSSTNQGNGANHPAGATTGATTAGSLSYPQNEESTSAASAAAAAELVSIPKLAKNRYGREEFLALCQSSVRSSQQVVSPATLRETLAGYYVEEAQEPVNMQPFSAVEQRLLLQGVNSSTALSLAKKMQADCVPPEEQIDHFAPSPSAALGPLVRAAGIGRGILRSTATTTNVSSAPALSTLGRGRGLRPLSQQNTLPAVGSRTTTMPGSGGVGGMVAVANVAQMPEAAAPALRSEPSLSWYDGEISEVKRDGPENWYYIDPNGDTQGPFDSNDMAGWFASGYFTMQLMVRREEEAVFTPLGDMIKKFGRMPFTRDTMPDKNEPSAEIDANTADDYSRSQSSSAASANGTLSIPIIPQYDDAATLDYAASRLPSMSDGCASNVVPNIVGDGLENMNLHEHGRSSSGRSSSVESELVTVFRDRDQAQTRAPQVQHIQSLPQPQPSQSEQSQNESIGEDFLRPELAALKERLKRDIEKKREEEAQKRKDEEVLRQIGERRQAALREQADQLKRVQEQIQAERELQSQIEQEVRRAAEEKETRRRVQEQALKRQQELEQRKREETRRMAAVLAEEERLKKLRQQEESGQIPPVKPAPWANTAVQDDQASQPTGQSYWHTRNDRSAQPLNEILAEEERQIKAEKRQEIILGMKQSRAGSQRSNSRMASSNDSVEEEGLWSTECFSAGGNRAEAGGGATADRFTKWCLKQVEALNSEVDAPTMVEFLLTIESPSDVLEYVTAYFGDCGPAKDFVETYLQKRNKLMPPNLRSKVPPSSSSSSQPSSGSYLRQDQQAEKAKKSSGKGKKLIVDGSALGFTSTADPNRVNAGQIERPM